MKNQQNENSLIFEESPSEGTPKEDPSVFGGENKSLQQGVRELKRIVKKLKDEAIAATARLADVERESGRLERELKENKSIMLAVVVILLVMVAGIMIDNFSSRIEIANSIKNNN